LKQRSVLPEFFHIDFSALLHHHEGDEHVLQVIAQFHFDVILHQAESIRQYILIEGDAVCSISKVEIEFSQYCDRVFYQWRIIASNTISIQVIESDKLLIMTFFKLRGLKIQNILTG